MMMRCVETCTLKC